MTFDQLYLPADGDEADVWAAMHEFELRQRRYRFARLGVIGVMMETRESLQKLSESLRGSMEQLGEKLGRTMYGDPDLRPDPRGGPG